MSVPLFRCGHPRTAENTVGSDPRCRTCNTARLRRDRQAAQPAERHLEHRVKYLPIALDNTRRKLRELENEARRYGMHALLTNPEHANRAWDRAVWDAQDAAEARGGSIGFGEARR